MPEPMQVMWLHPVEPDGDVGVLESMGTRIWFASIVL